MKARIFFIVTSLTLLISLVGCKYIDNKSKGENYLKIVDIMSSKESTLLGSDKIKKVKNLSKNYQELSKKDVPEWAKKSYEYTIHYAKHNINEKIIVYSNYKYAKVEGIPIVGNGTVKLNNNQYTLFNNPNKLMGENIWDN